MYIEIQVGGIGIILLCIICSVVCCILAKNRRNRNKYAANGWPRTSWSTLRREWNSTTTTCWTTCSKFKNISNFRTNFNRA
ncbi:uncharacterized protein CELE_M199.134 [Caenorhabditis elegans]|uniref:Secreted protein n=1 Tax=Caenorhabditis elegans TaxID=6239 RepID=I2HA80_CAEEL|nr:Secreted protein [Caenorhabditis elegans]CCH63787.1 Secreted protein [Caenorhabditis elegans]|eukprot:NP_001255857.1 Uncharacterized protein CELE_M199.134 [Caenorhabditis elegans]